MQFFIGIVPPGKIKNKIINLQHQWENNLLPYVAEPHITIKAQGGLDEKFDWVNEVEKVCHAFPPFTVTLTKPNFFGKEVLYLEVESEEIYLLHTKLVKSLSLSEVLIKKHMELDLFKPHLTLGQTHFGLSYKELCDMNELLLENIGNYSRFEVNFLRVYKESKPNTYTKFIDINLN